MDQLQGRLGEWARKTFSNQTATGIYTHLCEEVIELGVSIDRMEMLLSSHGSVENVMEEVADCLILLLNLSDHLEFSASEAVESKHTINRVREWGPPDEFGVHHHADHKEMNGEYTKNLEAVTGQTLSNS